MAMASKARQVKALTGDANIEQTRDRSPAGVDIAVQDLAYSVSVVLECR